MYKPGDILEASHRDLRRGYHPIVFIEDRSADDFLGAMITHHDDETRNVKMDVLHIEDGYQFEFDNSYLVKGLFIKPKEWGPFKKIGKLTEAGLAFVIKEIQGKPVEEFSRYFARHSK